MPHIFGTKGIMMLISLLSRSAMLISVANALLDPKYARNDGPSPSIPINLSAFYNNRAFAAEPNDANMDGLSNGYPAEYMPPSNFVYGGVKYNFPNYTSSGNDNIRATGEVINVTEGKYSSLHLFAAAESGTSVQGNLTLTYKDGSTSIGPILVPVWWYIYPYGGDIVFPFYYTNESTDYNRSMIYHSSNWIDPTKELVSIQLPNVTHALHFFSLSLWPASDAEQVNLEVQYARSTQKWLPGTDKVQIVEVIINNLGNKWVTRENMAEVSIFSDGYETVTPGLVKRLRPGDQAKVVVGVVNKGSTPQGSTGEASVVLSGEGLTATYPFNATFGVAPYEATYESIYTHESPEWFDGAKYGIFIHWGIYSVPGWGNVGSKEFYAEWYWWEMAIPDASSQIYEYNLATYGPNHTYDQFINDFTASAWDPKEWVDLFDDAGANYFVQVTKHHDGYALFDVPANVSLRTSVAQIPHRNFVQELFDAAKKYQPHLHRGTYFSLPEWFNPAYKPYGQGDWPGGNATNPYTNQTLPYTGFVAVEDFLQDVMLPQMRTLADMGTEIMWCDIGGANLSIEFASEWFNNVAANSTQVTMNDRCGLPGDFDTPEYATFGSVQARKWESNLGMDPYSYGYNRATPLASYMNATTIVTSLIDIISKNGNFLLDVGPQGNGSILQVEQDHLREAGSWIKSHGEAIFNTTYWFVTPEEGDSIRFTQTMDAFYIHILEQPQDTIVLDSPIPYLVGDTITTVGGDLAGSVVESSLLENGSLAISVPEEIVSGDEFVWVFKIAF